MIQERQPSPDDGPREPQEKSGIPEKADELLENARKRGRGLLDRQKNAAVEELSSVAGVIRDAAAKFEEKQEAAVGATVRRAADYLQDLSSRIQDRDLDELLQQSEQVLRTRPALCLGLTVASGFVLGRFLRASSKRVSEKVRAGRPGASDEANQ